MTGILLFERLLDRIFFLRVEVSAYPEAGIICFRGGFNLLTIYTQRSDIPSSLRFVNNNDVYFAARTKLQDTPVISTILSEIDGAIRLSDVTFSGKFEGNISLNKSFLSTGTKTLLNILQHSDTCFDVLECGDNAKALLGLISLNVSQAYVLWERNTIPYVLDKYISCDIMRNGVHYTDMNALADAMMYGDDFGSSDEEE